MQQIWMLSSGTNRLKLVHFYFLQKDEALEREKKVRADVEKAKRKLESDLKQTQEAVEELDRIKKELEENVRRFAYSFLLLNNS